MSSVWAILEVLVALAISPAVPGLDSDWRTSVRWNKEGPLLIFQAESSSIVQQCIESPHARIETPIMIQGGHEFILDNRLIASVGDKTYGKAFQTYNVLSVSCAEVKSGTTLVWRAFTSTHTLAHLHSFPKIMEGRSAASFFSSTVLIMTSGILFAVSIIFIVVFQGKIARRVLFSIFTGGMASSLSFACYVPSAFQINIDPLTLQKISDSSLWIGSMFLCSIFLLLETVPRRVYRLMVSFCLLGLTIILFSRSLDELQVGSSLSMLGGLVFLGVIIKNNLSWSGRNGHLWRTKTLQGIAAIVYGCAGLNDALWYLGAVATLPVFSVGVFFLVALLGLAVNEQIVRAYDERDYLRGNLEAEVKNKTEALQVKSNELEAALLRLRTAQSELIHSEKLASLGTLSTGIAHEINNSLNYVNGSILPIRKLLLKDVISEEDRAKAVRLLELMDEGLSLTFEIIANLKAHSRGATGAIEELKVREVVGGVLLLLKTKLSGFEIVTNISSDTSIRAERASVSQVLMNLISNAVDAISELRESEAVSRPPKIVIESVETGDGTLISVEDNGPGISPEIRNRIFDPFFTTKGIGKGTGLGLHIVHSEVTKCGGRLEVHSELGQGAKFKIFYPRQADEKAGAAA